jgi:Calx-beta domain
LPRKNSRRVVFDSLATCWCLLLVLLVGCDETNSDWGAEEVGNRSIWVETNNVTLSEGGESTRLSFALTMAPDFAVDVIFTSPAGQLEVGPEDTVRVYPMNWQDTFTVEVSAVEDHFAEESNHTGQLVIHSESRDSFYNLDVNRGSPFIFNIIDHEAAGLDLPSEQLVVNEGIGGNEPFSFHLLSQPTDDVTVTVGLESIDTNVQFMPAIPVLVFSPDNWNLDQTFYVRAVIDNVHGNHRSNSLVFSLASDDDYYSSLQVEPVAFEIVDSGREPRISFDQNSVNTVTEGDSETFDFRLTLDGTSVEDILFSIVAVTNPNSPQPGSDFVALPDTLVILPGESELTVSLEIVNDTEAEPDETGLFYLEALENCTVGGNTVQVIIVFTDDD